MAVTGALAGSLLMGIISFPSNLFIVYPFYRVAYSMDYPTIVGFYKAILPSVNELWQCLLIFNLPFTIAKGVISTVIAMLIYKPLSPILKGRNQ